MGARHANGVLQHLQGMLLREPAGLTDGQLLESFLARREEAAFAALVRRHGPMVFGVCRRLLGNGHDAEDAFQATFLILARKATSVVKRDAVGSWLYAVAQRTAREARAVLARRRARERQMDEMPHPEVGPAEPEDWRPILDREVARLPQKYREAVVLCDLQELSYASAAAALGCAIGTVRSRLHRGRALLAKRLRGVSDRESDGKAQGDNVALRVRKLRGGALYLFEGDAGLDGAGYVVAVVDHVFADFADHVGNHFHH